VIRRWLAKTPELLTAYLAWGNRGGWRGRGAFASALASAIAWAATVSMYVHDPAAVASGVEWLHRHAVFWAVVFAIASAVLVSRRRTLKQIAAPRSWTAALPIERSTALRQSIVLACAPALVLICAVAALAAGISVIALFDARMPAPTIAWAAITGGIVLGAGFSFLLPSARQDEIYEDSRYVPHRRRAETAIPVGSLSALGSWPVRQMFASVRPKNVSRAMLPILLSVPLGSKAADAMLAIGLLAAVGAVIILVAAVISVNARASRWLAPTPLSPGLLARRTLIPALGCMFCAAAIESWLMWLMGSAAGRCIATGIVTLSAGMIAAVCGGIFGARAGGKGGHGRL
jgi:hypothetical protein